MSLNAFCTCCVTATSNIHNRATFKTNATLWGCRAIALDVPFCDQWGSFRRFSIMAHARDDQSKRVVHCPSCDSLQLVSAHAKGWVSRECRERTCSQGTFEVAPVGECTDKSTFYHLKSMGEDFRTCPCCSFIIIRESGCREMTCACGHVFNWKSGKAWDDSTMAHTE